MEQTTLQQRIEERAKQRLLKDLKGIADKERDISSFIGRELYPAKLNIYTHSPSYSYGDNQEEILIKNEFTQKVFDEALPRYIRNVTDEILQKIDEIDYMLSSKKEQLEDLPY